MTGTDLEPAPAPAPGRQLAHTSPVSELAGLPPTAAMIRGWAMSLADATTLSRALVHTPFVPDSYRPRIPERADAVQRDSAIEVAVATGAAAILHGASIGFDPLAALQNIYVVSGRPGLYAEAMVALVKAAGHQIWVEDASDTRVVVCGRRLGEEHVERVTVTMDQAKKAGWTRNPKYQSEGETMLYARAASKTCRRIAPDVLKGIGSSVEELQDGEDQVHAAVATATRTVRRATPQPELDRAPLPGEDTTEPVPPAEKAKPAAARVNQRGATKAEAAPAAAVADARPALPGEDDPDADPPVEPLATSAQLAKMAVSFRAAGIEDKALRNAYVFDLVGREIASATHLTKAEASRVIDALEKDRNPAPEVTDAEVVEDVDEPGWGPDGEPRP